MQNSCTNKDLLFVYAQTFFILNSSIDGKNCLCEEKLISFATDIFHFNLLNIFIIAIFKSVDKSQCICKVK